MLKQFTNGVVLTVILALLFIAAHAREEYDVYDYCGIPPFPAKLNPIPHLPEHADIKSPKLMHFHTFVRHGDRSTIMKNCFAGVPELAGRVWDECPDSTSAGHNAMASRNPYRKPYIFQAKPMENVQVLDGNCHHGQLTRKGALMSYNNGLRVGAYVSEMFAKRDSVFGPNSLTLRSTNVHRTRETATSFITGLLDNMSDEVLQGHVITPVKFVDESVDSLKLNSNMCKSKEYLETVYGSDEWKQYDQEEWQPLAKLTGEVINETDADIHQVFDCAKTYHCLGKDLPAGFDQVDQRIEDANTYFWSYAFNFDHNLSSKVFSGVMVLDLIAVFGGASLRPSDADPTFTLYSGHDFGPMMNIISLFQIDNLIWPPYSSMLNVEMYHVDDEVKSYMRFIYNEIVYVPKFCQDKVVGDELCPTSVVLEYLGTVVPSTEECPRIPRTKVPLQQLRSLYDEATLMKTAGVYDGMTSLETIERLIQTLDTYDQQLQVQELLKTPTPKPEPSHLEMWSIAR